MLRLLLCYYFHYKNSKNNKKLLTLYKKYGKLFLYGFVFCFMQIKARKFLYRGGKMKVNWNKKYTTIAIYALLVIALAVLFVVFVFKFDDFKSTFSWIGSVAAPLISGIAIAYILNPLMMWFEVKLFRKLKEQKPAEDSLVVRTLKKTNVGDTAVAKQIEKHSASMEKRIRRRQVAARVLSLVLTFVVVLAAVAGVLVAVVPSIAKSIVDLADQMPTYMTELQAWANKVFEEYPEIAQMVSSEVSDFADLINKMLAELKPVAGDIIGNVGSGLFKFIGALFTGLKNVVIGLIIAIYLLYSKERLLGQCKKIIVAFFKKERVKSFFSGCAKCNDIFKKYIISNLLDAVIIFFFMVVGMFAMGMPYQMLIAVVCGVTNLIPFFGPFIGAIPCGFLILLVDPVKVIWFAIFVFILQQCDGNVIKPFLFGETLGLPAIWVLVSITIGGGLFGIWGMLLGAPVFAVIYLMFAEFVRSKLKKKNLPDNTDEYMGDFSEFSKQHFDNSDPPTEPHQPQTQSNPKPALADVKQPVTQKPCSSPQGKKPPRRRS